MSTHKRSLKHLIIEPFKQFKIGAYIITLSLLFIILCTWMIFVAFMEQYQQIIEIFHIIDPKLQWELITNDIFIHNGLKIGLLFLGFIVVMLIIVFKITHKYYGPLVAINRTLSSLEKGDYKVRVKLRKHDELQELAKNLNNLAHTLEYKNTEK